MREALYGLNNHLAVISQLHGLRAGGHADDDPRRDDLLEIRRAAEQARDVSLRLLAAPEPD